MIDKPSHHNPNWPLKQTWKNRIPYKVSCFIWILAKEAALTTDKEFKGTKTYPRIIFSYPSHQTTLRDMWDEVKNNSKKKVVNGRKTKFWKDEWYEKGNLEDPSEWPSGLGLGLPCWRSQV
ncbi:hypothetical protein MTR67_046080 [Solanum verrucosum]|uniref:Reverse transcriptase zinc-binding domain-containing protein n=1 Tax=Solanum verrucosum TaxID=315347 RepID=A0AAF0UV91_SOLVR|nr:hypothetical protein MTR67_046080 [Solanum verrucosum]